MLQILTLSPGPQLGGTLVVTALPERGRRKDCRVKAGAGSKEDLPPTGLALYNGVRSQCAGKLGNVLIEKYQLF